MSLKHFSGFVIFSYVAGFHKTPCDQETYSDDSECPTDLPLRDSQMIVSTGDCNKTVKIKIYQQIKTFDILLQKRVKQISLNTFFFFLIINVIETTFHVFNYVS